MEVVQNQKDKDLEVVISGRVDTSTAPQLEMALDLKNVQNLIFNLKDVSYVSSAGLRVFLSAYKTVSAQGGKVKFKQVNEDVMEVFYMVGFTEFLDIE